MTLKLPKLSYELGDRVWISVSDECHYGTEAGIVVGRFSLPDQVPVFYIISLTDRSHNHMQIRTAIHISDEAGATAPFWDMLKGINFKMKDKGQGGTLN